MTALLAWRATGSDWNGQTGFYERVFDSSVPQTSSETWADLFFWSQGTVRLPGACVSVAFTPEMGGAPADYWARIVLDYVPDDLNWGGPMEFAVNLRGQTAVLPVPWTDNPYDPTQVTRMHVTVFTPEPSCVVALAGRPGRLRSVDSETPCVRSGLHSRRLARAAE